MSWRGLCISSPARLDLRAGRLLLRREGEEDVALPLEDLGFVVIDTHSSRPVGNFADIDGAAGHQTQDHRLKLIAVDKEGQHRHRGVQPKNDPHQAGLRMLFPHPGGHDVRAAGGGSVQKNDTEPRSR